MPQERNCNWFRFWLLCNPYKTQHIDGTNTASNEPSGFINLIAFVHDFHFSDVETNGKCSTVKPQLTNKHFSGSKIWIMNSTRNDSIANRLRGEWIEVKRKSRNENQLLISEGDSAIRPSVGITFTWVVWWFTTESRYCDVDSIIYRLNYFNSCHRSEVSQFYGTREEKHSEVDNIPMLRINKLTRRVQFCRRKFTLIITNTAQCEW